MPQFKKSNLWSYEVVVITTNGSVKLDGRCVMETGCARQAVQRYPDIDLIVGKLLKKYGVHVFYLGEQHDKRKLISFPVKPDKAKYDEANVVSHMRGKFKKNDIIPGWACKASLDIIQKSIDELIFLVNKYNFKTVALPMMGCGKGELHPNDVVPLLEKLDDRFIVCYYEDEYEKYISQYLNKKII